jgi:1-pyrroline-4-hydroxy-2-carboxylate deaminase
MAVDQVHWSGVFPAATTQFDTQLAIDIDSTQRVQNALIEDGVDGLIVLGTVGENNSLEPEEKRSVLRAAVETAARRRPVVAGVAELTTARAAAYARDAEKIGVDGLMLLPAMVYVPTTEELCAHVRAVADATTLPIMLYNNPPAYRVSFELDALRVLADIPNIVCIKESAPDTRRITDVINAVGDRMFVFAGLDDVALEALLLGARGWVSGLTNVFPGESIALVKAAQSGDIGTALKLYRWFMPLLHLDADHDLVQCIKLAEQVMGRGSERVRLPRLPLSGPRRRHVIELVERAAAARPEPAGKRVSAG